jgi:ligand-binding SRPBCC domain-containing protein
MLGNPCGRWKSCGNLFSGIASRTLGHPNQSFSPQLLQSRGAVVNYRIQFEQWVAAPLEQVFPFFSNPSNLPRIMPPGLSTRLVRLCLTSRSTADPEGGTDHPGLAGVGSEIVTSFRIFPWLPWRVEWVAQVVGFEWNRHFADVQKKGPFKSFYHRHEFAAVRRNGVNGTIVRDVIRYEVGFGIFGKWTQNLLVIRKLKQTFQYRQMTLEKLLAQETQPG